ncbi:MAG: hypothetical protein KC492_22465 [Myxococcales bacterium]|nr:hypothetical protein [Myxococcales bacterium]
MKRLTLTGTALSTLWCVGAGVLLYLKRDSLCQLSLNEWGDFFAGFAAPLALFWLVLGYLQQGVELKLSSDALQAQQKELAAQVRETAALVKSATRQADAYEALVEEERRKIARAEAADRAAAMPRLRPQGGNGGGKQLLIKVRNDGSPIRRISVTGPDGCILVFDPESHLESNAMGTLSVGGEFQYPFNFDLRFTDRGNRDRVQRYKMLEDFNFVEEDEA